MANHSSKSYVECANETEGMVNGVIIKLFVTEDDSAANFFTDTQTVLINVPTKPSHSLYL